MNMMLCVDQQLRYPIRANPAILVQFIASQLCDGLDPAFHRDAVRATQQIQRLFIPQIDARLEADIHIPLGYPFQQFPNVLSHAKDLIDEVDVVHTSINQPIHFLQHLIHITLAKLVSE